MERELILTVKRSNYDKKKVNCEVETLKKMLPYIESFNTFVLNNDIFDRRSYKLIKKAGKVKQAFDEGLDKKNRYWIFCKN